MGNASKMRSYIFVHFFLLNFICNAHVQFCGTNNEEKTGVIQDDLLGLTGTDDTCVYRLKAENNERIKLKLHEATSENCDDKDKIYIRTEFRSYGPYCPTDLEGRHRRSIPTTGPALRKTIAPSAIPNINLKSAHDDGTVQWISDRVGSSPVPPVKRTRTSGANVLPEDF